MVDKKEKDRKLSKAEEKRLAHFTEVKEALAADGYKVTELTVGIVKANIFAILLAVPVILAVGIPFFVLNRGDVHMGNRFWSNPITLLILLCSLFVIHELIHGLTWGIFAKEHFKSIEFGFMKEYMTPYCTCCEPLSKGAYILGALMPLLVLGVIPSVISIFTGSLILFGLGFVMIIAAGGDVLIVLKLLMYKSAAEEMLIYDHPTQAGSVIFEK